MPYRQKWAVLIGINDYPYRSLRYPAKDAIALAKVLHEHYGLDAAHILLFLDEKSIATLKAERTAPSQSASPVDLESRSSDSRIDVRNVTLLPATRKSILHALLNTLGSKNSPVLQTGKKVKVEKNDAVFFFYAGHGEDKTGELIVNESYRAGKPVSTAKITFPELLHACDAMAAQDVFLIFDSCYSGNILKSAKALGAVGNNIQAISSGTTNEVVADQRGTDGHSIFNYHLLNILKSGAPDGIWQASEIMTEVTTRVNQDEINIKSTIRQHPQRGDLRNPGQGRNFRLKPVGTPLVPWAYVTALQFSGNPTARLAATKNMYRWVETLPVRQKLAAATQITDLIGNQLLEDLREQEKRQPNALHFEGNVLEMVSDLAKWHTPNSIAYLAQLTPYINMYEMACRYPAIRRASLLALRDTNLAPDWESFNRLAVYATSPKEVRYEQHRSWESMKGDPEWIKLATDRAAFSLNLKFDSGAADWLTEHGDPRGLKAAIRATNSNEFKTNDSAFKSIGKAVSQPKLSSQAINELMKLAVSPSPNIWHPAIEQLWDHGMPAIIPLFMLAPEEDTLKPPATLKQLLEIREMPLTFQIEKLASLTAYQGDASHDSLSRFNSTCSLVYGALAGTGRKEAADFLYQHCNGDVDAIPLSFSTAGNSLTNDTTSANLRYWSQANRDESLNCLASMKDPRSVPLLIERLKRNSSAEDSADCLESDLSWLNQFEPAVFDATTVAYNKTEFVRLLLAITREYSVLASGKATGGMRARVVILAADLLAILHSPEAADGLKGTLKGMRFEVEEYQVAFSHLVRALVACSPTATLAPLTAGQLYDNGNEDAYRAAYNALVAEFAYADMGKNFDTDWGALAQTGVPSLTLQSWDRNSLQPLTETDKIIEKCQIIQLLMAVGDYQSAIPLLHAVATESESLQGTSEIDISLGGFDPQALLGICLLQQGDLDAGINELRFACQKRLRSVPKPAPLLDSYDEDDYYPKRKHLKLFQRYLATEYYQSYLLAALLTRARIRYVLQDETEAQKLFATFPSELLCRAKLMTARRVLWLQSGQGSQLSTVALPLAHRLLDSARTLKEYGNEEEFVLGQLLVSDINSSRGNLEQAYDDLWITWHSDFSPYSILEREISGMGPAPQDDMTLRKLKESVLSRFFDANTHRALTSALEHDRQYTLALTLLKNYIKRVPDSASDLTANLRRLEAERSPKHGVIRYYRPVSK